jgi:hypothetical protein
MANIVHRRITTGRQAPGVLLPPKMRLIIYGTPGPASGRCPLSNCTPPTSGCQCRPEGRSEWTEVGRPKMGQKLLSPLSVPEVQRHDKEHFWLMSTGKCHGMSTGMIYGVASASDPP